MGKTRAQMAQGPFLEAGRGMGAGGGAEDQRSLAYQLKSVDGQFQTEPVSIKAMITLVALRGDVIGIRSNPPGHLGRLPKPSSASISVSAAAGSWSSENLRDRRKTLGQDPGFFVCECGKGWERGSVEEEGHGES